MPDPDKLGTYGRCRVFVSYAHNDELLKDARSSPAAGIPRAFLNQLKAAVGALPGWRGERTIFFDTERLSKEYQWSDAIKKALNECELLILLVSTHSLNSQYCLPVEVASAFHRGVPIIPVILSPCYGWFKYDIPDPEDPAKSQIKLGQCHSAGLPKDKGGNAKAVSEWENEASALNSACSHIVDFILDKLPEDAPDADLSSASLAEVERAPTGSTELQKMLALHLNSSWGRIRGFSGFENVDPFAARLGELCPKLIFQLCVSEEPDALLQDFWAFVRKRDDGSSSVADLNRIAERRDAVLLMALVAAERYVAIEQEYLAIKDGEPLGGQDTRIIAVLGAACFGFGLKLTPSKAEPDNFVPLPADELGYEQGKTLIKRELYAAAVRVAVEPIIATPDVSDRLLGRILGRLRDSLGYSFVLVSNDSGPLREEGLRTEVQDVFKAKTMLRGVPRDEVRGLIGDLQALIAPILNGTLGVLESPPATN